MGMFDRFIIAENWLPEGKKISFDDQDFQTKDLDCQLGLGDVMEDGKLYYTQIDDDEKELRAPYNHTGEIRFYDMDNAFVAWCVNGVVKEVIDITNND